MHLLHVQDSWPLNESLIIAGRARVFLTQERRSIPRYKRPGIDENEVKERVLKLISRVAPNSHGVEFRKIRQIGPLWEAEGSFRSEGKEFPRRFTIRFNSQGAVKFKDVEPP